VKNAPAEPLPTAEWTRLAQAISDAAAERAATVRVLGGVGVYLRANGASVASRSYGDLDLAAREGERGRVETALAASHLRPDEAFNRRNGHRRQIWWIDGQHHVDVFLGQFAMCHRLELASRLDVPHLALPAADLLLTKLQVVELNRKDVLDAASLLLSHELARDDGEGCLNEARLAQVLGNDWGFHTTAADNLDRLPALAAEDLDDGARALLARRVAALQDALEAMPKSRGYRMRARVGRRVRWYELPDETIED
jgi:hypothetical protein